MNAKTSPWLTQWLPTSDAPRPKESVAGVIAVAPFYARKQKFVRSEAVEARYWHPKWQLARNLHDVANSVAKKKKPPHRGRLCFF